MSWRKTLIFNLLETNGFRLLRIVGSHHMFFKEEIGTIPVPHPKKICQLALTILFLKKQGLNSPVPKNTLEVSV